ncbi:MAG: hypothetical protein GF405_09715 [Candidatus Eisenbacteria bacterium]|nr:hypothetical protein [Candidatus Eisenbacteria bacterium]
MMRTLIAFALILAAAAEAEGPAWSPDVLELVAEEDREALASALDDAGTNAPELADALAQLTGEERDAALWLIERMPHLDRLEMTTGALTEHVSVAFETRGGLPDSLFLPYVLTYRIDREPVEAWRGPLRDLWFEEEAPRRLAARINEAIAAAVSERERGFFGPLQPPLFTLAAGSGTETEIAILTTAALRAVGLPCRRVRTPVRGSADGSMSWIEFHNGATWVPLYPLEPASLGDVGRVERDHRASVSIVEASAGFETRLVTERYTSTANLELTFLSSGGPAAGFEHFSISVFSEGALVPLDALGAAADEDGRFVAELGDGRYVVAAGVRDEQGDPLVKMLEVRLEPGDERSLAFDVSPDQTPPGGAVPVTAWVASDPANEPDVRMLPIIASALAVRGADVTYIALGDPGSVERLKLLLGPKARVVSSSELNQVPAFSGGLDSVETPVIELYDVRTKQAILRHEGYDLNVGRIIEAAGASTGDTGGESR